MTAKYNKCLFGIINFQQDPFWADLVDGYQHLSQKELAQISKQQSEVDVYLINYVRSKLAHIPSLVLK